MFKVNYKDTRTITTQLTRQLVVLTVRIFVKMQNICMTIGRNGEYISDIFNRYSAIIN